MFWEVDSLTDPEYDVIIKNVTFAQPHVLVCITLVM